MSKWFGLSLALVFIATSSTASAQAIMRYGRLVAEQQPAPVAEQPAQPEAEPAVEPAPEPAMEGPIMEGTLGKGAVTYGYPFNDGCCGTTSCCGDVWGGYVPGCGRGCGLRRHCGLRSRCSLGCSSACAPTCYPSVTYGGKSCGDPCNTCADPCNTYRRPGIFSRLHARKALCGSSGCDYGWGMPYSSGYGFSSGCNSCGGGAVIKGDVKGDVIEPTPKEVQPLDAPVIENKSVQWWQSGSGPRMIPTSLSH